MRCSVCLEVKMLHCRRCSGLGRLNTECRMPPATTGLHPQPTGQGAAQALGPHPGDQRLISRSLRAALALEALGKRSRPCFPTLLNLAATGISQLQTWQRQVLAKRPAEQTVSFATRKRPGDP
jgi:ribonuclease PH